MALFKIEKGLAANLAINRPDSVEGYCYFTSDDGKFYIDISTGKALTPAENGGKLAGATRMPINSYLSDWAVRAYADRNGNDIACTYGNRLSLSDKYTLKLIASDSTELGIITLPKDVDTASKFTSAQTIELTGAVTGSTSSQAGWTVSTTLANNIVKTANISDKAVTNEKLANSSITIGGKTVNLGGTLTLADIGLNTALRFIGATSTAITDGSTTSSIVINGSNVTPTIGDVIINNNNSQEYVWLGSAWELLGDESSYALKTITISGSNGLTGSGTLSGNITLSHADTSNQDSISASGRRYITGVTLDTYGHVTGLTTGTETVTDTHYTTKLFATGSSGTAHDATTNGNTYLRLFDNNTARQSIKIVGSGATTVTSDANGIITISSTDNNTTYGLMSIDEGATGAETINRVLNAANLKGIINAHAPTKTGSGASGTWNISISGNAATATALNTNAGSLRQPVYFNGGKPVAAADDYVFYDETTSLAGGADAIYVKLTGDTMTGTLTAPKFIGNLQGNATTATKATQDGNGNIISSTYLPLAGGTMNDQAWIAWPDTGNWGNSNAGVTFPVQHGGLKWNGQSNWIKIFSEESASDMLDMIMQFGDDGSSALKIRHSDGTDKVKISAAGRIDAVSVYGAVWNDYAEFRICKDNFKPGQVVCENNDDTLSISTYRLQPGANIVSDTYGFAIGETDKAKCPIAVSGRVLAYTYEPREEFNAGEAVCAGPNGTVSKMTREEIREYPERIIGTVSAVPSYETWGSGNVEVDGRIWIKVR